MKKKNIALLLATTLCFGCAVGGTLAWLTDTTDTVTNTFAVGDINIKLEEHVYNPATGFLTEATTTENDEYKIIPGFDLPKDPYVTVEGGSEACYLFVKVEESNWPTFTEEGSTTRKVNYAIASGWTELEGEDGVYYRTVDAIEENVTFDVLANNEVTVSGTLTKTEAETISIPTLTFTAYAIQKDYLETTNMTEIWELAN